MRDEKSQIIRIEGKARVLDRLFAMIEKAQDNVVLAMRYLGSKWGDEKLFKEVILPRLKQSIREALSAGAKIRIIGDLTEDTFSVSKDLQDMGVELKDFSGIHLRFAVIDNQECLFAISEPYTETTHYYHAIWANDKVLVSFFRDYFKSLWPLGKKMSSDKS